MIHFILNLSPRDHVGQVNLDTVKLLDTQNRARQLIFVMTLITLPRNYLPISICQCTVFLHNSHRKLSTSGFGRF